MLSEIEDIVDFADISLNSELESIKKIGEVANRKNKTHGIILMIDVGDLREGVWPDQAMEYIRAILRIDGVRLEGIGTNVTCYGAVLPTTENLSILVRINEQVKNELKYTLPIVSGGNSSSILLMKQNGIPSGINQLRLGEVMLLGRETETGNFLEELNNDVFTLGAEIIEIKNKPSVPIGKIGVDGFGSTPEFIDKGIRTRAIVALGRQDIKINTYQPIDKSISVLGSSSDHMMLDISECENSYKLGDIITFSINYEGLLSVCTSEYVQKKIV